MDEAILMNDHTLTEKPRCEILGVVGLIVQAALGLLSFAALLVKRYFEHPKRTWLIWVLDTSKQVFSAALSHCMNMLLAIMLSGGSKADNCDWYFITTVSDVFIGIFLAFLILRGIEKLGGHYSIAALNTGVYIKSSAKVLDVDNFVPEKQEEVEEIDYKVYLIQLLIWGAIVCIVKVFLFVFQRLLYYNLEILTTVLFGWLNIYPNLKLILIMVLLPLIFNSLQFWIQDNILKSDKEKNTEFVTSGRIFRSSTMIPQRKKRLDASRMAKRAETIVSTRRGLFGDDQDEASQAVTSQSRI